MSLMIIWKHGLQSDNTNVVLGTGTSVLVLSLMLLLSSYL